MKSYTITLEINDVCLVLGLMEYVQTSPEAFARAANEPVNEVEVHVGEALKRLESQLGERLEDGGFRFK